MRLCSLILYPKFFIIFIIFIIVDSKADSHSQWSFVPQVSGLHFAIPIYRTARSFGAKGDGISDDTYALMRAFSSGENLNLEGRKYLIDVSKPGALYGLKPRSNQMIEGNGAQIILKPNKLGTYSMITIVNKKNVKIYNLKLIGDVKYHYKDSAGEWGMGFMMVGCKDCELHHVEANEMWGDGFYVGSYGEKTNEGGGVFNSSARANRRVGISVARCKNFTIRDSTFMDTGTIKIVSPGYGVDIEPNPNDYDSIDGIRLINISTENNRGGGILFVPRNLEFSTHPDPVFNVYMENYVSKNDGFKKYWLSSGIRFVERFSHSIYRGFVNIRGVNIVNLKSGGVPYRWERNDDSSLTVHAVDLKIDNAHQSDYHN